MRNQGGTTRALVPGGMRALCFVARRREEKRTMLARKRILTGDRPTGRLHLGHWVGTLHNRVRLQQEYECFFLVADYHILTTRLENLEEIEQNVRDMVLD